MDKMEERAREWLGVLPNMADDGSHPDGGFLAIQVSGQTVRSLAAAFRKVAEEAVAGERERCVTVVRDHLAKAATIRQAIAQPGMDPELSPERKQEEHRIAAATLALGPPLAKALRTGSPS